MCFQPAIFMFQFPQRNGQAYMCMLLDIQPTSRTDDFRIDPNSQTRLRWNFWIVKVLWLYNISMSPNCENGSLLTASITYTVVSHIAFESHNCLFKRMQLHENAEGSCRGWRGVSTAQHSKKIFSFFSLQPLDRVHFKIERVLKG